MTSLLRARNNLQSLCQGINLKLALDAVKQSGWQKAVIEAAGRYRPQVRPWPNEAISLAYKNPGTAFVQPETLFRGQRNFYRRGGIARR